MDQATDLRALVRQFGTAHAPAAVRPRRIVVFGGKGGVGTTTIAVNLAVALAQQGQGSLLCDAAGGDVALHCRLNRDIRWPSAGRKADAGPGLAAGSGRSAGPARRAGIGPLAGDGGHAWNRLMAQLPSLRPARGGGHRCRQPARSLARQLWQAADRVLLVATVERAAVMGAYASIKLLSDATRPAPIALVVNRSPREATADETKQRMVRACRRFLGVCLRSAGQVPEDAAVPECAARGQPLVLAMPACPAGRQLRQVARRWESSWLRGSLPRPEPRIQDPIHKQKQGERLAEARKSRGRSGFPA